jgi:hypothetical protein
MAGTLTVGLAVPATALAAPASAPAPIAGHSAPVGTSATATAAGEPGEEGAEASEPAESPATAARTDLYGYQPLTPWRQPPVGLPGAAAIDYAAFAEAGLVQAARWHHAGWYCEYLGCTNGQYPLATIWASVPLFEAVDALATAQPTAAHLSLVRRFAGYSEHFWDNAAGGYAPYPGDRAGNVEIWFDDNGWLGLAFLNAYRATHEHRWLSDAQRALHFIATRGWDPAGGMWWNTYHPYHSGPALSADSLLGMLLYEEDHEVWQLEDVKTWVDWANVSDNHDERQLYLEKPNAPESVNDYVQAPLIYAQYLLCKAGAGEGYCTRAGRVAATMAERRVNRTGYRYNYGPEYDTIYLQWMMAYGAATGETYWLELAELNAAAAARHAANGEGLWLSSWWGGPIRDPETHPNMIRTVGATTSLFAWISVYAGPQTAAPPVAPPPALVHRSGHPRHRHGRRARAEHHRKGRHARHGHRRHGHRRRRHG